MLRVLSIFMCLVSYFSYCSNDRYIWWSVFLVSTLVFIYYLKCNGVGLSSMILYFLLQEISGFFYLVCNDWKYQFFILMFKSGVAPLHFWLFNILGEVKGFVLNWFLVLQKLPYFFGLLDLGSWFSFFFVVLGLLSCHFHLLVSRFFVYFVSIVVTESFSWLLLLCMSLGFGYELFFFIYYLGMFFIIPSISSFYVGRFDILGILVIFNIPFMFTFFVKVLFLIFYGFYFNYFFLFLLTLPVMSFGVVYFFLVGNLRDYLVSFKMVSSSFFYFFVILMGVLFV